MVFWCGEGVRLLHPFVAAAAAAAGAEKRVFFSLFLEIFAVTFGRLFGTKLGGVLVWPRGSSFALFHEIRWCFGVATGFVFCIVSWQWQQQQLEQKSVCFSHFF